MQDLRYAARGLRRNPLFVATATLSLAIGIGASTSIFTVINALLLRVAPGVAAPETVVDLVRHVPDSGPGLAEISVPLLRDLRERARTLEQVFGYRAQPTVVSLRRADGSTEPAFATLVTTNFFSALGVRASAGRLLGAIDSEIHAASPVVVLSDAYWARRFQRDRSVVGTTVRINGSPLTIVGVVEAFFSGLSVVVPDVWVPISMAHVVMPGIGRNVLTDRDAPLLTVGARLAPGVSRDRASGEVEGIGAALERESTARVARSPNGSPAERTATWSVESATPIPYGLRPVVGGFLALLMSLTTAVLLIACGNLAGVLLARGVTRRREIAIRAAIGAGRARIVQQLLTETVVLFLLGGIAGMVLARGVLAALEALLPAFAVHVHVSSPLDGRVTAFALLLSLAAALIAGLTPSLHASRADVVTAIKDDAQGPVDRLRMRQGFVIAQIAGSIALLVVAGLLVRGFGAQMAVDRGFDAEHVDVIALDLAPAGYTPAAALVFGERVVDAIRARAGVEAVSFGDRAPEPGGQTFGRLEVPGVSPSERGGFFNWTLVAPRYFETVGIPLVKGRDFTDHDRAAAAPVVILGEAAATRLFGPGTDPTGRFVAVHDTPRGSGETTSAPRLVQVVGIVGDVRFGRAPSLAVYAPVAQHDTTALTLVVRNSSPAGRDPAYVRRLVTELDPDVLVLSTAPLTNRGSGPVEAQLRVAAAIASSVALVGLWLASIGVYGVTAYTVSQRSREIAIRLSLGATGRDIAAALLAQSMRLVTLGSAFGLLLALGAGRLLAHSQLGVRGFDPGVLAAAAAALGAVCLAACVVPVARAYRIAPAKALRFD